MIKTLRELRPFLFTFSKRPADMSRKEAELEFRNFMSLMPGRIEYFEGVLGKEGVSTSGDDTEVISQAGEWVARLGRLVKVPSDVDPRFKEGDPDKDLSLETMSACCYLGVMFGERMRNRITGCSWVLVTENKRDVDYHRPVLRTDVCRTQLEPIRICFNFLRTRYDGALPSRNLGDLFSIWEGILSARG